MSFIVGRRPLLQGLAALGASSLISAPAVAAKKTVPTLDPANPRDQALIFRKLAWATDDRMGFWWTRGTRYGIVDNEMTPFWEMHIGSFFRVRDISEDEYEVTSLSIGFYTDIKTGEFIKKMINPLTGKEITITYYPPNPPKPSKLRFNQTGRADPAANTAPGNVDIGATGPAWIEGDEVWVRGDHLTSHPATATSPIYRINDLPTYAGSLKDVADPKVKMPLATQIFSDINSWPAYLNMGDRAGSWYSRILGRKVATYEELPAGWRKLLEQEHPDIAKDPAKVMEG